MAISFDCLTRSLAPFVPGPLDVIPVEKIEDWLNPGRMFAKAVASNFNLRSEEFSIFEEWWALSGAARGMRDLNRKAGEEGPLTLEVRAAFARLAAIVNDAAEYEQLGYRFVHRVPAEGRFVVFSDLHMSFPGSRHDFFRTSGNSELYAEALTAYAEAGFTLIENGDVEDLIIHEPSAPPPQATLEARAEWRRVQLTQVILNHRALYEQINAQFVEQGRYIRIAGNHDQDLQDPGFLDVLRSVYPALEQVYDFLIIESDENGSPGVVIGHGHHFDLVSTPAFAAQIGEMLSECLGWAYEGADRVWRWDNVDGVQRWATGGEAFANTLVTDEADPYELPSHVVDALRAALESLLLPPVPWNLTPAATLVLIGAAASELSKPGMWEGIFHGNIAWEYFRSADPGEAIFNEVFCGERWFKFRHLDEVFIDEQLGGLFGSDPPYLLLGHSHEPRHLAWNPATSAQSERYLNSGSAGRFGNLVWGVEIIDGVPQVVAWHRPGGPGSGEAPERRTYTPGHKSGAGQLTASDGHVPLSALDDEEDDTTRWLAPILHVMLSKP
jgi:hypothetical protein